MHLIKLCIALSAITSLTTHASESGGTFSDDTRTITCTIRTFQTGTTTMYQQEIHPHGKITTAQCTRYEKGGEIFAASIRPSKGEPVVALANPEKAFDSCQEIWDHYKKSAAVRNNRDCSIS